MAAPKLPPVPQLTSAGFTDPVWARWLDQLRLFVGQALTALSINSANGFTGSVSGAGQITIGISVTGILKGTGGGIVAAVPGVDYLAAFTANAPLVYTPNTLSIPKATGSVDGYLSATDWSTFNSKLSGNQTITLTGDVTGSGATGITTTLAASGVTAGTYGSGTVVPQITVDAKGRITAVTNQTITSTYTPAGGATGARPASPLLYTVYFDTTLGQPIWCKSLGPTVWVNSAGVVV